jgi:hypothetical protein
MSDGLSREDAGEQLEVLKRWWAEHPELANHPHLSLSEWMSMTGVEKYAFAQPDIDAINSVTDFHQVNDRIRRLGQRGYQPAVPTLIEIWRACAVRPIREAAGHALFATGTPEAWAPLRAGVDDYEDLNRFLAFKTMFADGRSSWTNLSPLFEPNRLATPGGARAAQEVLEFLGPSMFSREGPIWSFDSMRNRLSEDKRWLDLCVGLRRHPHLGRVARAALRYADPAVTTPVLNLAADAGASIERPRLAPPVLGSLLARYEAGEHRQVWSELAAADPLDEPWRAEAELVAVATMTRVRRNAERLVAALAAKGWPVAPDAALPAVPSDVELRLAQLNQISGPPVPPAMAAFWRIVGSLDLVPEDGKIPAGLPQELIKLDPLQVFSLSYAWPEVDEWRENAKEVHSEIAGPIELPISADNLHKAGISGAGPYGIWFPSEAADPLVRDEPHDLRFTDYLRRAFENKGFLLASEPPFDRDAIAWIDSLAVELEPF